MIPGAKRALFEIRMYSRGHRYMCFIRDREQTPPKVYDGTSTNPAEAVMLALLAMGDAAPGYIQNADPSNWDDDTHSE